MRGFCLLGQGGVSPPGLARIATPPSTPPTTPSARGVSPPGLARIATVAFGGGDPFGRLGGVSPPGLARIATRARSGHSAVRLQWRQPSGAGEDRNDLYASHLPSHLLVASALRGWRGSQLRRPSPGRREGARVASALRGWRGSQLRGCLMAGERTIRWRQPSGAGEDRNGAVLTSDTVTVPWRQPSGAGEDRNGRVGAGCGGWLSSGGVSPPGLARIATLAMRRVRTVCSPVASALRGWRGSQQRLVQRSGLRVRVGGVSPPGLARIATRTSPASAIGGSARGVSPPGLARIATPGRRRRRGSRRCGWRQPSGAGEDRNASASADHPPG